jgi:4-amino-4-deoxy-L-arabinose transferase-like glycosyltransferase
LVGEALPARHAAACKIARGTRGLVVETALVAGLVLAAAVVRIVDLWAIPIFTDEGDEIGLALRILRDGARPLTNDDPYLGPLYNYLLAGMFWLFGTSPWTPRLLMLALGAATIIPTYLLARELALAAGGDRRAGMLAGAFAGGLLAVNAGHVYVISHVAWGNCLTPLLTTAAGWLLARAARLSSTPENKAQPPAHPATPSVVHGDERSPLPLSAPERGSEGEVHPGSGGEVRSRVGWGVALVLACGAFGLALQTHPSVAVLLPGAGLYVIWQRRRWLLTPWPYLGALALVAAQAPTLSFIGRDGLGTWLDAIREKQEMYERDGALGLPEVVARFGQAVHTFGASLGGLLNDRDTPLPPLWHPLILLTLVLAVAALAWLVRRREPLVPLVVLSGLLLLPVVNGKYAPLVSNVRYLEPLTILTIAALGAGTACRFGRERADLLGRAARAAVLVVLVGSVVSLVTFSADARRDGRTNGDLLVALVRLEQAHRPGDVVTIDRAMYRDWTLTEGRLQRVFESWLEVRGIPHRVVDVEDGGRLRADLAQRGGLAVLARRTVAPVSRSYQVEEIATDAAPGAPAGTGYSVVRVRRSGG